tara:strand:- start:150033 stop:150152 length:120 start_codon:yes stop_codon:yes gene_type:complete
VIIEIKISTLMLGSVQRMTIYDREDDGFGYGFAEDKREG